MEAAYKYFETRREKKEERFAIPEYARYRLSPICAPRHANQPYFVRLSSRPGRNLPLPISNYNA